MENYQLSRKSAKSQNDTMILVFKFMERVYKEAKKPDMKVKPEYQNVHAVREGDITHLVFANYQSIARITILKNDLDICEDLRSFVFGLNEGTTCLKVEKVNSDYRLVKMPEDTRYIKSINKLFDINDKYEASHRGSCSGVIIAALHKLCHDDIVFDIDVLTPLLPLTDYFATVRTNRDSFKAPISIDFGTRYSIVIVPVTVITTS